ncbi:type I toxin-antitoxin system toxin TisB [Klebsiella pneumoniae]|nr:type I toxin-antitoxin system toxin TisB [Klebsiella pneumoniae]MBS2793736.1 type I toxin-antitoxin system toxin TisB [Klebsiella pneumoniae]
MCSLTAGDARMGGMDIIILILKLMVAVLQLLDAVLKQFR